MRIYKIVVSLLLLGLAGAMTFSRCTAVDDSLGGGFDQGDQQMGLGTASFSFSPDASRPFFETRLFHTDSVRSSNIGTGYLGAMNDATFGSRSASFLAQYYAVALSDLDGFGYRPIFDSIQLKLSVTQNAGDTLRPIRYNVYEVISNEYLQKGAGKVSDTLFYATFDPTPYVDSDPLFTFTFPDGTKEGPRKEYITLQPTAKGLALVRRLMLLEGTYKDDVTIYEKPALWTDYFKGIYIAPAEEVTGTGNLLATNLKESGFLLYGRNRNETDPTLIQDTVSASYAFRTTSSKYNTASINIIRHDYTGSSVDFAAADENTADRPLTQTLYVEGMNGVISELTFTDALFEQLEELYQKANAERPDQSGLPYTSLALNKAELSLYLEGADYDAAKIDAGTITPWLDRSIKRLGMYTDYKELAGIADYPFAYERLAGSGFVLPYGGLLSRGRGCYVMDVSNYLQSVWNEWQKAEDKSSIERTIYIAPEAYGLYTMPQTVLQGMEGGTNNAPIQLKLMYTLIK